MAILNIKRKKRKGKWRRRFQSRFKYDTAIQEIYKFFVRPWLDQYKLLEEQLEFKEGLNCFFNIETRKVFFCATTKAFKLPGLLWIGESPARMVPGMGKRLIIKGTPIVVRIDTTMPKRFADVEVWGNIYSLTEVEYLTINECLEIIG